MGRATLIAAVGSSTALDLGLASAVAADGPAPERLTFGELEGLVALMQDTPASRIVSAVIAESKRGTDPKRLVTAAALANARAFGGEGYVGFHTFEDGALHAEKYYRTCAEEFATARKAFRWRQLIALARVTASEFGRPAPGVSEAHKRLGIG